MFRCTCNRLYKMVIESIATAYLNLANLSHQNHSPKIGPLDYFGKNVAKAGPPRPILVAKSGAPCQK